MSADSCLVALEKSTIQAAKCVLADAVAIARKEGIGFYEVAVLSDWQGNAPCRSDGALFEIYTRLSRRTLLTSYDCAAFLYPYGISMETGWVAQPAQPSTPLFAVTLASPGETLHRIQSESRERYRECLITATPTGCLVKLAYAADYYQLAGNLVCLPTKADARRLIDQVLGFRILQAIPTSQRRTIILQDLHIVCRREHVEALVSAYKQEFGDNDAVALIDWGYTRKLERGFIVLEWDGDVDEALLERLHHDPQILDYGVYRVPCTEFGLPSLPYVLERL